MLEPQYKVITNHDLVKLEQEVDKHIALNWKPIGGVAYAIINHVGQAMQAMYKE